MNTTLRHWKEAATLILAAGRRFSADGLSSRTPLDFSQGRSHLPHSTCFDYEVLMLKRSGKSKFMPSAYVFPGGAVDSSDFSSEWLDIFKPFSDAPSFGLRTVNQPLESRSPMFATDRLKLGSPIPGEVAFRICALRETFEESGVLLAVSKREENNLEDICAPCQLPDNKVHELCSAELSRWRTLVIQNPSNFIRMCRELEVLPNIWALHEWSNWLTPVGKYGATRFDTAFFISCLQNVPDTLHDAKEIERFQWSTPSEVLQTYQAQKIWIATPQFYELSRMCRFPLLTDLHHFCTQRGTDGCEQWLPVFSKDDRNTVIALLPGDKEYPTDTRESTEHQLTHPQDSGLHRVLISDSYINHLQITITPKYNHVLPVMGQAFSRVSSSHL